MASSDPQNTSSTSASPNQTDLTQSLTDWSLIRSPQWPQIDSGLRAPRIHLDELRREFIWKLVCWANPSFDEDRLRNIHGAATLTAYQWAASMGWISVTGRVMEFLIHLAIWSSHFFGYCPPWSGLVDLGNLDIVGASQGYQNWLNLNPRALYRRNIWLNVPGHLISQVQSNHEMPTTGTRVFENISFTGWSIHTIRPCRGIDGTHGGSIEELFDDEHQE